MKSERLFSVPMLCKALLAPLAASLVVGCQGTQAEEPAAEAPSEARSGAGTVASDALVTASAALTTSTTYDVVGDFDGDGRSDVFSYTPGGARAWVALARTNGWSTPSCNLGEGFYGYDFRDPNDKALVLDYDNDGADDLFFYRPGHGAAYLMRSNRDGSFTPVYASNGGLGGFDFMDARDIALRIDYNGDGKDDLLMYRQETGIVYMARSQGDGSYVNVLASASGLAGMPLTGANNRILVGDFNRDKREDLLLYQPGTLRMVVAVSNWNVDGGFLTWYNPFGSQAVFMADTRDRALLFDYDGDLADDILLYQPGSSRVTVLMEIDRPTLYPTTAYSSNSGIGGFDFLDPADRVEALDYNGDGAEDLLLYRPGHGVAYVARSNKNGTFSTAFASSSGIGGFSLASPDDVLLPFKFNSDTQGDVLGYRPTSSGDGRAAVSNGTGGFLNGPCVNICSSLCSF